MEKNIDAFIAEHGITCDVEQVPANPHNIDTEWAKKARHYYVTLAKGGARMSVYFSVGSLWLNRHATAGHRKRIESNAPEKSVFLAKYGKPEARDVLDYLAMDASDIHAGCDFEDWASGLGYDTDSRKAEATYNTIRKQAKELKALLGPDAFRELIEDIERL